MYKDTTDIRFRTWSIRTGLVLAGVVAGAMGQRYLGAPRVEVRTETKVETRDVIHETVKVEVREVEAKAKSVVVYRDRTVTVEGAVHETSIEKSEETFVATAIASQQAILEATRESASTSTTVTTPVLPRWRVAVLAGASIREPLLPLAGPLVLGVEVDYRVVGPVWVGAWLNTFGAAGVSVGGEF